MSEIAKHWIDSDWVGSGTVSQLPQGRLLDRPRGNRRGAVPRLTLSITDSAPEQAATPPELSASLESSSD